MSSGTVKKKEKFFAIFSANKSIMPHPTAKTNRILAKIEEYFKLVWDNGYYDRHRREQSRYWMYESINETLKNMFYENSRIEKLMPEYEQAVLDGQLESFSAAEELIDKYLGKI